MKSFILMMTLLSTSAFAGVYDIKMTCGEVAKVGNGDLLKRLEPNLIGLNAKFALKTKFKRAIDIHETAMKKDKPKVPTFQYAEKKTALTYFSLKDKFQDQKYDFKEELSETRRLGVPLYACVGHISVFPFKYEGSHVFFTRKSYKEAVNLMRKQARRHL